jgi:hypothetical protein
MHNESMPLIQLSPWTRILIQAEIDIPVDKGVWTVRTSKLYGISSIVVFLD